MAVAVAEGGISVIHRNGIRAGRSSGRGEDLNTGSSVPFTFPIRAINDAAALETLRISSVPSRRRPPGGIITTAISGLKKISAG